MEEHKTLENTIIGMTYSRPILTLLVFLPWLAITDLRTYVSSFSTGQPYLSSESDLPSLLFLSFISWFLYLWHQPTHRSYLSYILLYGWWWYVTGKYKYLMSILKWYVRKLILFLQMVKTHNLTSFPNKQIVSSLYI